MGQYRVIVVDDEEEIREGIIRKIDWNALGYEVVGSAENGVEALELAEHLPPGCDYDRYQDVVYGWLAAVRAYCRKDAFCKNDYFFWV